MDWPENGRVEATNSESKEERREERESSDSGGWEAEQGAEADGSQDRTDKEEQATKVSAESYAGSLLLSRSHFAPLLPRMIAVEKGGEVPSCQWEQEDWEKCEERRRRAEKQHRGDVKQREQQRGNLREERVGAEAYCETSCRDKYPW
jgi:hypothetical protein